jgi:hypothetical protein
MEAVGNLLKELGRHIGLDQLELDDEGQCTLAFDEDIVVTFVADPEGGLNAVSFVGELPDSGAESFAKKLLAENFLPSNHGGARFAIEPNSNRVVAVGRWDAQKTDVNSFSAQLEAYVNSIDLMQKTMANATFDAPISSAKQVDGRSSPPPGGAVFA